MVVQSVAQFRLAHQNNLEQLPVICLQIGQQAYLFEQFVRQVLRFCIDDEYRLAVRRHLTKEKVIDDRIDLDTRSNPHVQAEFHGDGLDELVGIEDGIKDERRGKGKPELLQQRAAQRRLARADFAGELHKPLALANPVKQMVERLAMLGAEEQKPRVRSDRERRFGQLMIFQVLARILYPSSMPS